MDHGATDTLGGRARSTWQTAGSLAVLLTSSLMAFPAARAENPTLAEARALYDELSYTEAYQAYSKALAVKGNRPGEIAHIYERLGIISAAGDRNEEALGHFKRLICLNPDARLSGGLSPKVQHPFEQALAQASQERPFRLLQKSVRLLSDAGGLVLEVELEPDSLGLATGVTLNYRKAGSGVFQALTREGHGTLWLTVGPGELPAGSSAEYFLQVNDSHGGVLWELGAERSPFVKRIAGDGTQVLSASAVDGQPTMNSSTNRSDDGEWYQEPLVWVGAGAGALVLVAGVTTVAVIAALAGDGSPVDFGEMKHEIAQAR
ncbi:MAG: hypothetical protein ABIJ09_23100 [Pseudomonadota bacterium]